MLTKYSKWIKENIPTAEEACDQCTFYSKAMVMKFPELTLVAGYYQDNYDGNTRHWWCTDANGEIIDPTAKQFHPKATGIYNPLNGNQETPVGKCMNCGDLCYESTGGNINFCSDHCCTECFGE